MPLEISQTCWWVSTYFFRSSWSYLCTLAAFQSLKELTRQENSWHLLDAILTTSLWFLLLYDNLYSQVDTNLYFSVCRVDNEPFLAHANRYMLTKPCWRTSFPIPPLAGRSFRHKWQGDTRVGLVPLCVGWKGTPSTDIQLRTVCASVPQAHSRKTCLHQLHNPSTDVR